MKSAAPSWLKSWYNLGGTIATNSKKENRLILKPGHQPEAIEEWLLNIDPELTFSLSVQNSSLRDSEFNVVGLIQLWIAPRNKTLTALNIFQFTKNWQKDIVPLIDKKASQEEWYKTFFSSPLSKFSNDELLGMFILFQQLYSKELEECIITTKSLMSKDHASMRIADGWKEVIINHFPRNLYSEVLSELRTRKIL